MSKIRPSTQIMQDGAATNQGLVWNGSAWVPANLFADPTTTKGDLLVRSASAVSRLGVGADTQVLTADSTQALGVKWAAAGAGSSGYATVQDEGTGLTARTILDFVGAGVTATDDAANTRTLVTIPGASGGATTVVKTADETVTSSIVLQDDDHLFFSAAANDTWTIRYTLFVDGATGGDIKATITVPTGATGIVGVLGPGTTATTFENATVDNQATTGFPTVAPPAGALGAGNIAIVIVVATVFVSTTAGTIKLQWAQNTSSGTATKVYKGSFLTAFKA